MTPVCAKCGHEDVHVGSGIGCLAGGCRCRAFIEAKPVPPTPKEER